MKKLSKYIDLKVGLAGSFVMGVTVFCINFFGTDDLKNSLFASGKQAVYTFFIGGFVMRFCELLAVRYHKRAKALLIAVILPSLLTLSLTYVMHNLKGTPKPFESTLPTLMIIPATLVWGIRKRKRSNKILK